MPFRETLRTWGMETRATRIGRNRVAVATQYTGVPRLLTAAEVAEVLRCHPATVGRERLRGRLRCVRVGRRVLYREDQVAAYLDVEGPEWDENGEMKQCGFPGGRETRSGTSPGSTAEADRLAAEALANETIRRLKSSLRNGD